MTGAWEGQSRWPLPRSHLSIENYAGHFAGALHATASGCVNSAYNGAVETFGTLVITQNGSPLSMQIAENGGASCAYIGTLNQYGQTGDVRGSYTCTDGAGGTFEFYEMQVYGTEPRCALQDRQHHSCGVPAGGMVRRNQRYYLLETSRKACLMAAALPPVPSLMPSFVLFQLPRMGRAA